MQLDAITVEAKNLTEATVTLVFKVNASLSATDENEVAWGLIATVQGHGVRWISVDVEGGGSGLMPFPAFTEDTRFVGSPQTPKNLTQGSNWNPTFEATYQRVDISVPANDVYFIYAKLVPIFEINESETRRTYLRMDL
jgi:hypothetical protein